MANARSKRRGWVKLALILMENWETPAQRGHPRDREEGQGPNNVWSTDVKNLAGHLNRWDEEEFLAETSCLIGLVLGFPPRNDWQIRQGVNLPESPASLAKRSGSKERQQPERGP